MIRRVLLLLLLGSSWSNAPKNQVVLVGFPSLLQESDTQFDMLGGSKGSTWVNDAHSFPVKSGSYTLWNIKGKLKTAGTGSARVPQAPPCQHLYSVTVQPALHREGWLIASNASWNLHPRAVTAVPPNNPAHLEAIRTHLKKAGLSNPSIDLLSVTRADLDGDQQDEVILVAAHSIRNSNLFPVPHGDQGTYGLILLRKLDSVGELFS